SSRLAKLASSEEALRRLGLIIGGDVTILQERMAIASTAMPRVQTDESTLVTAFVTSMVEAHAAKGSGWSTGTRLDDFTDEAGGEAAQAALPPVAPPPPPSRPPPPSLPSSWLPFSPPAPPTRSTLRRPRFWDVSALAWRRPRCRSTTMAPCRR